MKHLLFNPRSLRSNKKGGGTKKFVALLIVLGFGLGNWNGYEIYREMIEKGCVQLPADVIKTDVPLETSSLKFVAMGDIGTGNTEQKQVAQAVARVCEKEGCDFVLLLGDNFYPDGVASLEDPQFKTTFEAMYSSIQKPFFAVLGNHDTHGNALAQVMYSLKSPQWRMPNFNYHFKAGPAQFFAINTECHLLSWMRLQNQMESATSSPPWTFVYTHHPIYGSGTHGDTDLLMRYVWGFFEEEVDFYLSGHDHELEHLRQSGGNTEYIISGAGGAHYRSPKEREKTTVSQIDSQFVYQDTGFVWFEVSETQVHVKFFNREGEIYQFTKRKS